MLFLHCMRYIEFCYTKILIKLVSYLISDIISKDPRCRNIMQIFCQI